MPRLEKFSVRGFRSIRELEDFELRPLNVFIGPNGAGKSNLIAFFRLLIRMLDHNLQFHVAELGGANAILHDGAATTQQLSGTLNFQVGPGMWGYEFILTHAAQDTLIFRDESYGMIAAKSPSTWFSLGSGHREALLLDQDRLFHPGVRLFTGGLLGGCVVYQFHNTSATARIRQKWDEEDSRYLKEDGANLAPFLSALRDNHPAHYRRIVETLRQILPFFADFVLESVNSKLLLQWRENHTDMVFGSHQASDGTLRIMALVALLLQPTDTMPSVLILDEPELGLHPFAINVIGGLIRNASRHAQILLATQSVALLDQFEPEDVVVVNRKGRESTFERVDAVRLKEWLREYSLAELWEKNVLGGRPSS